jgi:predicted RNA-binding Zn ribbon-like protein
MGEMAKKPAPVPADTVDAGRALAFVNTLWPRPAEPTETLVSYDALLGWARDQKLLSASAIERLQAQARKHPHQAALVLGRVRELREAFHLVLTAVELKKTPPAEAIDILGRNLAGAYAHGTLVPHEGALQWTSLGDDELDRVVWEIAHATGRLILSPRVANVRSCGAGDCGWWFLDETKNHSRRWCDMKTCGNREKLRRFRKRA